jgi:hypothetical protein
MLFGGFARGQCGVLELQLPVWANGHRAQQFLLQREPSLRQRKRRAVVLRRTARQRQMPTAEYAAEIELSDRIRFDRRRLLPCRSGDLDRNVLSERASAERPKQ